MKRKYPFFFQPTVASLLVIFIVQVICLPRYSFAQTLSGLMLPSAVNILQHTPPYQPPMLLGMRLDTQDSLKFTFFVHPGVDNLQGENFKNESKKLLEYFLAALATPDRELWVNLSPYERDRIITKSLGNTQLGKDMLVQDYLLKQLTAYLTHPEQKLGEQFWKRIRTKAKRDFGLSEDELPSKTFNKIWIIPEKASVYIHGQNVFVTNQHLKVMLEEDYFALEQNYIANDPSYKTNAIQHKMSHTVKEDDISTDIFRDIFLPQIEKEVNEGKTFSDLRQIFNAVILSTWYKKHYKQSALGHAYIDQNKISGIKIGDKNVAQKVHNQYVKLFQEGVYNIIHEDYDPSTQKIIPRKYFSGGIMPRVDTIITNSYAPTRIDVSMLSESLEVNGTFFYSPNAEGGGGSDNQKNAEPEKKIAEIITRQHIVRFGDDEEKFHESNLDSRDVLNGIVVDTFENGYYALTAKEGVEKIFSNATIPYALRETVPKYRRIYIDDAQEFNRPNYEYIDFVRDVGDFSLIKITYIDHLSLNDTEDAFGNTPKKSSRQDREIIDRDKKIVDGYKLTENHSFLNKIQPRSNNKQFGEFVWGAEGNPFFREVDALKKLEPTLSKLKNIQVGLTSGDAHLGATIVDKENEFLGLITNMHESVLEIAFLTQENIENIREAISEDKAMIVFSPSHKETFPVSTSSTNTTGGLDFHSEHMDLHVEGDLNFSVSVQSPSDAAIFSDINFEMLYPVILQITPVTNTAMLLGMTLEKDDLEGITLKRKYPN